MGQEANAQTEEVTQHESNIHSGALTKTHGNRLKPGLNSMPTLRTLGKFVHSLNETYSGIKCSVAEYFPDASMWR